MSPDLTRREILVAGGLSLAFGKEAAAWGVQKLRRGIERSKLPRRVTSRLALSPDETKSPWLALEMDRGEYAELAGGYTVTEKGIAVPVGYKGKTILSPEAGGQEERLKGGQVDFTPAEGLTHFLMPVYDTIKGRGVKVGPFTGEDKNHKKHPNTKIGLTRKKEKRGEFMPKDENSMLIDHIEDEQDLAFETVKIDGREYIVRYLVPKIEKKLDRPLQQEGMVAPALFFDADRSRSYPQRFYPEEDCMTPYAERRVKEIQILEGPMFLAIKGEVKGTDKDKKLRRKVKSPAGEVISIVDDA